MPKRTFVVVSHTHWDREWYRPFEAFRARLVRMMDNLLDLLDSDPEYRHFVLDGQTVPLDDYLEIRPDRRPDIERLVKAGRLLIGPNYILPDEFLIGAESWVRNLMLGIRSARQYGGAMMVGYSPDAFGHIAHLPAILNGFGLQSVLIWRGVGREVTTSEFIWAAPDGSEVLAIHFPYGYGMMPTLPEDRESLTHALASMRALLEPFATTSRVLVPNGTDHLEAHRGLPAVIGMANNIQEDAEMVHGDYPSYVDAVRRELDGRSKELPRLSGEFRSSARSHVLAGVLSTRMWLKQRYQECEDLLARRAEPLAVWSHLLSSTNGDGSGRFLSTRGLLRHTWKLLLQNGPHDSVTGCSVDPVYDDVAIRFNRCQQSAETVLTEAQRHIAGLAAPRDGTHVVVFNSEAGPRSDFGTATLTAEDRRLPSALVAPDGARVPLQLLERGIRSPRDGRERVVAGFVAPEVPGFGYRGLRVEYGEQEAPGRPADGAIENEYFRVTADPADGTLTVEDKRHGHLLAGLNRFVDGGDRGDEYTYNQPDADRIIDALARPPAIAVVEAGPARHTLEVRLTYALPAALSDDRKSRAPETIDCAISSRVSLYPGVLRIDIETTVDNRALDHRLRVHFPAGLRADTSDAEQHFGVVQRPVALPEADSTWMETPVGTYPQKSFVDVSDGERGLMLANRGLPEYEALPAPDGTATLALTLVRCVGWLSRNDLSARRGDAGPSLEAPGAQLPGRWTFRYSLIPHEGGWEQAYAEAHRFARPLHAVRVESGRGELPAEGSLVSIEPPALVLSALKPAEDGESVIVRVYNIAPRPVDGRLRLNQLHSAVELVDLNEENGRPAKLEDGWVQLSARPNQIITLRFAPA